MTPQEKELIQNVASKLKQSPEKAKDAEAKQLIGNEIGSQQDAIYKLTQAVLVQEMALKEMKQKNEYLEKCVEHHKSESNRGAFSKMMGGNKPAPQPPKPAHLPSAFGSFMQTAASVAVGMVAGNMISNALFNNDDPAADTMATADAAPEAAMGEDLASSEEGSGGFLDGSTGFASEYTENSGGFGDAGFGDSGFGDAGFGDSGFDDSFANTPSDDAGFGSDDSFFGGSDDFGFGDEDV